MSADADGMMLIQLLSLGMNLGGSPEKIQMILLISDGEYLVLACVPRAGG